jgi:hypothetical protein
MPECSQLNVTEDHMPAKITSMQTLTHTLGVRLPDGRTFQVSSTEEDLDLLLGLLVLLPKEERGKGVLVTIDDDMVHCSSTGKEVFRVPHGNAVQVPDIRPQMQKLIKETGAQPPPRTT